MNKTEALDIQIRAHVENLAAFAEMQAQMKALGVEADALSVKTLRSGELSVRGNVTGDVSRLGAITAGLEGAGAQVAGFRSVAAEAEHSTNATKHLEEAVHHGATTWGLYGENVDGVSRRLGGIQGLMGGGLAMGAAGLGGAAVLGFSIEAGKASVENAEKQERAQALLRQSADATGQSYTKLAQASENWIQSNSAFVKDQFDATTAMALFTRAGNDQATVQKAMNAALDLSVLKGMSMSEAARTVELAMMGNSRAVKDLGIDLKSLNSDEAVTETATKELDKALKSQEASAAKLSAANQTLRDAEDGLHGKRVLSQLDLDHLAEKHAAVAKAQADLATANAAVAKAQSDLGSSQGKGAVILDELSGKIKGARDATTELERAHNDLNVTWGRLTAEQGPAVLGFLAGATTKMNDLLKGMESVGADQPFWDKLNWLVVNYGKFGPLSGLAPLGAAAKAIDAARPATGPGGQPNRAGLGRDIDGIGDSHNLLSAMTGDVERVNTALFRHNEILDQQASASARAGDGMRLLREGLDTNGIASSQSAHEVARLTAHEAALQRETGISSGKFDDWSGSLRLASLAAEEHQKALHDTEWAAMSAANSVDTVRESISHANQERLEIKVQKSELDDAITKLLTLQQAAAQGVSVSISTAGSGIPGTGILAGNNANGIGGFQSP